MQHLITTADFTNNEILELFKDANIFLDLQTSSLLKDKLIVTLFFENSTRTRSSFEIAAKRLGASVVNLEVQTSSTKKGETVEDTIANLNAMKPDAIIIRHSECGLPASMVNHVNCPILNAGDGMNAHPTQALLDLFTIYEYFDSDIENKKIAIVGDIKNSRVANSNIELLNRFKADITLVSPPHSAPSYQNIKQTSNLKDVIDKCDAIISLRTQTERHKNQIYANLKDYAIDYKITKELIKDKDIFVLHPGPVHRNIDIDDEVLKDSRSLVLKQVENGVAIRMAVLEMLLCS